MKLDAAQDIALRARLDQPPKLDGAAKATALRQALRKGDGGLKRFVAPLLGPGKLTVDEVLYYGLCGGGITAQEALRFVGKRKQAALHAACNDPQWFAATHDKALFYSVVAGAGMRVPTTRATAGRKLRGGYPRHLPDEASIAAFLRDTTGWPLFAKPIDGMYSIGTLKLTGGEDGEVDVFGVGRVPIDEVGAYMSAISADGYLFQDCLVPAPFAAQTFGDKVPSARLLVLFSGNRPVLESAVLKVPSGDHAADNYWRGRNMLASLDRESGTLVRVVSGMGPDLVEHETHPVTGARMLGVAIPDWSEVVAAALAAASIFPGVRTQSWDVALSAEGPVLLEFNFGGDLNLHQIAHRRGAMTPAYAEHLRLCGYKGKLA